MPGIDVKQNEIRVRQNPPGKYKKYGRLSLGKDSGVSLVRGQLDNGNWETQSVRFDRDKFDVAKVKEWIKAHSDYHMNEGEYDEAETEQFEEMKDTIETPGTAKFSDHGKFRFSEAQLPTNIGTDGDWAWIELCREINAIHPEQGRVVITEKTIDNMIKNFDEGVRGLFELKEDGSPDYSKPILDLDYDHKEYNGKAAGWLSKLEKRYVKLSDGSKVASLWGKPGQWSTEAQKDIRDKAYKFTSVEFDDWKNPETGKMYKDVLFGAAITNRPFVKDQAAITLAEKKEITKKEETKPMLMKLREMFGVTGAVKLAENATDENVIEATIKHITKLTEAKNAAETKLAESNKLVEGYKERHNKFMEGKIVKLSEGRVSPADRKKGVYAKFLKEKRYDELADFLKLMPKKLKEKSLSESETDNPEGEIVYASESAKLDAQITKYMKDNKMPTNLDDKDFNKNYTSAYEAVRKENAEAVLKKYAEAEAAKAKKTTESESESESEDEDEDESAAPIKDKKPSDDGAEETEEEEEDE